MVKQKSFWDDIPELELQNTRSGRIEHIVYTENENIDHPLLKALRKQKWWSDEKEKNKSLYITVNISGFDNSTYFFLYRAIDKAKFVKKYRNKKRVDLVRVNGYFNIDLT